MSMSNMIEVHWWVPGGKKSSDKFVAHVRYLKAKNRGSAPTKATRVVFFTSNFSRSLVI